jgi:hypothetical protein
MPVCLDCRFYRPSTTADDLPGMARRLIGHLNQSRDAIDHEAAGVMRDLLKHYSSGAWGQCRLGPSYVPRQPDDWCGKHTAKGGEA